jgi:hypothetical protein
MRSFIATIAIISTHKNKASTLTLSFCNHPNKKIAHKHFKHWGASQHILQQEYYTKTLLVGGTPRPQPAKKKGGCELRPTMHNTQENV